MHIRVDDQVEVMIGRDKSLRAKVLRMLRDEGKVVVEGVNTVWKHMRRSQKNPRGGRLHKEMPVQISNVQLVCPACGQATRTGVRFKDDGSKHRYCKKCSAEIGQLSPAKKRRAKVAGV
ncbi:MAG: 50S ribosomal protein L24 [Pirellulales bacterium]